MRDRDAHDSALLALRADARRRDAGLAAVQERRHDLEQLALVDRAAVQLEVDRTWAEIGVEVSSVEMYSGEA